MANRGNHWKTLDDRHRGEEWLNCPNCGIKPFVWEFDNGRFAECDCGEQYKRESASAIAVLTYYKEHNTMIGFPGDELRVNWNNLIRNRIRKNKIKKILEWN